MKTLFETDSIEGLRVRVVELTDDGMITIEFRERLSLCWQDYYSCPNPPRELIAPLIQALIDRVDYYKERTTACQR